MTEFELGLSGKAEHWISQFNKDNLPKDQISVSFSRSSGPGGQNVNKVSTKVDMRFRLDDAHWIPDYAREKLKSSHRLNKSGELVIMSDKSRTQSKNIQDCYDKLTTIIKQAVAVQREADSGALARIEKRRLIEDSKRIDQKKRHANKKTDRRTKSNDY
ncbi:hypothetical protein [Absidia glauca]|uniref:Prokaryotic-type class I peptide chain release factors domain-containing protein n=1 Tax=Absidia glauca TaxID=4829 RepID=A0A163K6F9_ABSGL|nr:hypothetical protein [Absidia glauca]